MESRRVSSSSEGNAIRIENPFTLKVGQVFTGFGIGCGVGIGVGRPLNLGAIPMLNQVMSATRGATDAFSGVSRHVNTSLKKLGAKNIEVGIGCGVGFGHGFGVGLAVKPGVLNQIQSCLAVAMTKMMMKFGLSPSLPFSQGAFPASLQSATSTVNTDKISAGSMMQIATKSVDQVSQGLTGSQPMQIGSAFENTALKGTAVDSAFGSRTEKVINSFLHNPLLKGEGGLDEAAGRLQSENKIVQTAGHLQRENKILQMVLKHQQIIEELVEENEKLRQILVEDLKIPSSKLQTSSSGSPRHRDSPSIIFATGGEGSPVEGEGEGDVLGEEDGVDDGEGAGGDGGDEVGLMVGLGLSGPGIGTGEEAAGEGVGGNGIIGVGMAECVGAGLGAWAADIATRVNDMARPRRSLARVSAIEEHFRQVGAGVVVKRNRAVGFVL
ncbi:hypothetical protein SESBI_36384 [Sesbania bispinosa]|nr:hypothetical protein SESBI_36384 [Sesbania bispinosa]